MKRGLDSSNHFVASGLDTNRVAMRSSHRLRAHPDTRPGPDPCSQVTGNSTARLPGPSHPADDRTVMSPRSSSSRDPASSHASSDIDREETASDTDAETRSRAERLQSCAREFLHLLHGMPVSTARKQTAIRLLIKAVRLITPKASIEGPARASDGEGEAASASNGEATPEDASSNGSSSSSDVPAVMAL